MKDLIERLEKATVPDREVDCFIALLPCAPEVGVRKPRDANDRRKILEILGGRRAFGIEGEEGCHEGDELQQYLPATNADHFGIPAYTASIDAALTLVPEGAWRRGFDYWPPHKSDEDARRYWAHVSNGDAYVCVRAHTAAYALCIAALKAHEMLTSQ